MQKILQAWNFKTLQEFKNIVLHLSSKGKTIDEAIEYITAVQEGRIKLDSYDYKKQSSKQSTINIEKNCEQPGCQGMMELFTVCCSDASKKKEGYFTKWECKACGFVDYDKRKLEEIRSELNA